MPRATCRCGQVLSVPVDGPERVICPKCSARIKVRRATAPADEGDGFIRFNCPCGRRLKVRAGGDEETPEEGKCPDCGQIVPVPAPSSSGDLNPRDLGPESRTDELDTADFALLDRWSAKHVGEQPPSPSPAPAVDEPPPVDENPAYAPTGALPAVAPAKAEAGLRICPRCGRPLHLSAVACRNCGAPVPKR